MQNQAQEIKDKILELTKKYYQEQFGEKDTYSYDDRIN